MAVKYEWVWGPMQLQDIDNFNDVVTGVYWTCIASDDTAITDKYGKETGLMLAPPPDPASFVTANTITQSVIDGWIPTCIDKSSIEQICLGYLDNIPSIKQMDIPIDIVTPSE